MKIDKRNPIHWLYLLLLSGNVLAAMLLRPLLHRRKTGRVLLYGHKRSGNLLAIHDWVLANHPDGLDMRYLTMDPHHYDELRRHGVPCVLAINPKAIGWLATADAIVSDHGLHAIRFMLGTTDLEFFDVWHGIPFKGFDADDFRVQRRYDAVWVASPFLASMYVEKFGFRPDQVEVTGYARTDRLVMCRNNDPRQAANALGLGSDASRIVLFAPTWKQDVSSRNLLPFGLDVGAFCEALSTMGGRHGATIVFRTHVNSGPLGESIGEWPHLAALPASQFPDTEQILLASEILLCDWSSIAFDFLLLDRPTLFLEVAAPFKKGYSLGPDYRYGRVVSSLETLLDGLDEALAQPELYWAQFDARHKWVKSKIYGQMADGRATERCLSRLQDAVAFRIAKNGPSP